jgi:isopentenyl diphosphate isomerase/L-lactate dehydrogenase-like FMN-dependent dehydrogenase
VATVSADAAHFFILRRSHIRRKERNGILMQNREEAVDSNLVTREYFDELLVEMRHFDAVLPDTTLNLYGETFKTPVMTAALSHIKGKGNQGDGMVEMAKGALQAGAVNWAGMGDLEQFARIAKTGARTIKIIKPYADESMVISRMEQAQSAGALAVGMDLDHSFNGRGQYDCVLGIPMRPRTLADIQSCVRRTSLPFVIKGVLSVQDALKCLDAGVGGIVVSHHHGILRSAVPPLRTIGTGRLKRLAPPQAAKFSRI